MDLRITSATLYRWAIGAIFKWLAGSINALYCKHLHIRSFTEALNVHVAYEARWRNEIRTFFVAGISNRWNQVVYMIYYKSI